MKRFDKLNKSILFVSLMLCYVLTGCFAATVPGNYSPPMSYSVVSLSPASVVYGIQSAISGVPGTSILVNGNQYLFIWGYSDLQAAGFWAVDLNTMKSVDISSLVKSGGNFVNSKTVGPLVDLLKDNGWKPAVLSELPAVFANVVGTRVLTAPVMIMVLGSFGPNGDFESWFDSTFVPETQDL